MTSKTVAPVAVRSIDLLRFLANRGIISKLEKVSAEPVNGIHLPIFMFRPCFKVQQALAAYGKSDDRMNDKEMWWMEYDDSYFTAPLDKKTINSANYRAVERLVNEGFGSYLVDIRYRVNSKDSENLTVKFIGLWRMIVSVKLKRRKMQNLMLAGRNGKSRKPRPLKLSQKKG